MTGAIRPGWLRPLAQADAPVPLCPCATCWLAVALLLLWTRPGGVWGGRHP